MMIRWKYSMPFFDNSCLGCIGPLAASCTADCIDELKSAIGDMHHGQHKRGWGHEIAVHGAISGIQPAMNPWLLYLHPHVYIYAGICWYLLYSVYFEHSWIMNIHMPNWCDCGGEIVHTCSYWKLERVRGWTSRPSSARASALRKFTTRKSGTGNVEMPRPSSQSDIGHDLGPQLLLHLYNSPASEVRRGSWVLSSLARCPWALWFHLAVHAQFEGPIPCIEAGCQPKWQNPASIFDRLEAANSCDTAPLLWRRVFILTRHARGGCSEVDARLVDAEGDMLCWNLYDNLRQPFETLVHWHQSEDPA